MTCVLKSFELNPDMSMTCKLSVFPWMSKKSIVLLKRRMGYKVNLELEVTVFNPWR